MKRSTSRIRMATVFAVAVLVSAPFLRAQMQLRGLVISSEGKGLVAPITIKIDNYSTPDEILMLKQLMMSGDVNKFYKALRAKDKGYMNVPSAFSSANEWNSHFNIAFEQPSEKEDRILLIAESRIVKQGTSYGGPYYFLVMELSLNKNHEGEGRIYHAAKISFPREGGVALESYATVPYQISNIRPVGTSGKKDKSAGELH